MNKLSMNLFNTQNVLYSEKWFFLIIRNIVGARELFTERCFYFNFFFFNFFFGGGGGGGKLFCCCEKKNILEPLFVRV